MCLQETWYSKQELELGNTLHSDFLSVGAAVVDHSTGLIYGRPYGGAAIFYRKTLAGVIKPLKFTLCDWCVGIEFSTDNCSFIILNVYLPYECSDNEDDYIKCLSELQTIIESLGNTSFAIVGDWNANLLPDNNGIIKSTFAKYVLDFCECNELNISSRVCLPPDSYTYVSERWGTFSWLDHAITSNDFHSSISSMYICHEVTCTDHIPFSFKVVTGNLPKIDNSTHTNDIYCAKTRWKTASRDSFELYNTFTDLYYLSDLCYDTIPCCTNVNCKDPEHRNVLASTYDRFVSTLLKASDRAIKHGRAGISKSAKKKPGWSTMVEEKFRASRMSFKMWQDHGKPRHGPVFDLYYRDKLSYKHAVRYIKRNENKLQADGMATALCNHDYAGFWSTVKCINNSKPPLPECIGDAHGVEEVKQEWKTHYEGILNSVSGSADNKFFKINVSSKDVPTITLVQLFMCIQSMSNKKSCGLDGIFLEHLLHCSLSMLSLLCSLFNSFIMHGFLPKDMMSVMISPLLKSKAGNLCDKDNYRPIALANFLSKLFECILVRKLQPYLLTCSNQFGFKKSSSTDMCLFVLKDVIDYYNSLNSNVFVCFLDASKAFDRVNHAKLFNLLQGRGVPLIFIRIIAFWYKFQLMCVKWGNSLSSFFSVSNGVRQGSVLSPHLFNVYVDEISKCLNSLNIGCQLDGLLLNHLFYADDLCIFAPSTAGLQILIDKCYTAGLELDIAFNASKCKVMHFRCKYFKYCVFPSFSIGNLCLQVCSSFKYLGHILSSDGSDDLDIQRQLKSVYARGNSLIRKFHMCSNHIKALLFKSYCSSLYTCQLWRSYKAATFRRLNVAFHCTFKQMLNVSRFESNSMTFVTNGVSTCQEVIRKSVFSFQCRIYESRNAILMCIVRSSHFQRSPLFLKWQNLLFCD